MPALYPTLLLCLGAYMLGSVLMAPLVCRLFRLPDPRRQGSGNPGATNVYRLGGRWPALLTLVLDAAKGAVPVILAGIMGLPLVWGAIVAMCAIAGHMLPVFSRFRGGKGVATALGACLVLAPLSTLVLATLWLLIFWCWRISSLASVITALAAPLVSAWLEPHTLTIFLLIATLILIRHRTNLLRLWRGSERRL